MRQLSQPLNFGGISFHIWVYGGFAHAFFKFVVFKLFISRIVHPNHESFSPLRLSARDL